MTAPRITLESEAAFLLLVARRVLNFRRAAEKNGEVFVDMSKPNALKCGIKAKMSFETTGSGYQPVLFIQEEPIVGLEQATQAATELMGTAVKYRGSNKGLYEFERAP